MTPAGYSGFPGRNVWTDNDNVYVSNGNYHYKLTYTDTPYETTSMLYPFTIINQGGE